MNRLYISKKCAEYQSALKTYTEISEYLSRKSLSAQELATSLKEKQDEESLNGCIQALQDSVTYQKLEKEFLERIVNTRFEFERFIEKSRKDLNRK